MRTRVLAVLALIVVGCRADRPPPQQASQRSMISDRPSRAEESDFSAPELGPELEPELGPELAPGLAELPPAAPLPKLPTRFPATDRLVAFGDVHGDLQATRAALKLAGALGDDDQWIGGNLVVVQTGDQLDRGDDEQAILELFERLIGGAARTGGALHALNGNHEVMNVAGDLRYVTEGGFADFADVPGLDLSDPQIAQAPSATKPRAAAFKPGGPYARILAHRNVVVVVGDTVFAHGGVLPKHVEGLDAFNVAVRDWMNGTAADPGPTMQEAMASDSPVWTRLYSDDRNPAACKILRQALQRLNVRRMVVGHTVQKNGITSACHGQVWRVDVGMARHYGGSPQVLEIRGAAVQVLK